MSAPGPVVKKVLKLGAKKHRNATEAERAEVDGVIPEAAAAAILARPPAGPPAGAAPAAAKPPPPPPTAPPARPRPRPPTAAAQLQAAAAAAAAEPTAVVRKVGKKTIFPAQYGEQESLAAGIFSVEDEDPYVTDTTVFPIPSRRGFQKKILQTYDAFIKVDDGQPIDFEACRKMGEAGEAKVQIYLYQQFVREYMKQLSPYRGLLVYHGLGSGKTCSAIATAEALFSTTRKRIIVMTPFSLRENFIKEITFCGFRHYRLQNFWVKLDGRDPSVAMFARELLNLEDTYIKRNPDIWVPDFNKEEPNYDTLTPAERDQIRKQLSTQIQSRITFINYNGITSTKLKAMACQPGEKGFFDDAVVVVDEVHNLTRLMQGTIEPYLIQLPGVHRRIAPEPVTPGRWRPSLCASPKNYKRGYLLYRMLTSARNCKFIGLSGTPLINFPEELGILVNLLHGYIDIGKMLVNPATPSAVKEITAIANENPFTDFVETKLTTSGVELLFTPLPEGTRKAYGADGTMEGVQKLAEGVEFPAVQDIAEQIKASLTSKGYSIAREPTFSSEPLLPPVGMQFREQFIMPDGLSIKNSIVLRKRIQGLISYYRGSKQELMPAIKSDTLVPCVMSPYQRTEYMRVRLEEVKREQEKKGKKQPTIQGYTGRVAALWGEIYDISVMKNSNNYRMTSRQVLNFAFPEKITRPRASNQNEITEELGADIDVLLDNDVEAARAVGKEEEVLVGEQLGEGEDSDEAAAAAEDEAIEENEKREAAAEGDEVAAEELAEEEAAKSGESSQASSGSSSQNSQESEATTGGGTPEEQEGTAAPRPAAPARPPLPPGPPPGRPAAAARRPPGPGAVAAAPPPPPPPGRAPPGGPPPAAARGRVTLKELEAQRAAFAEKCRQGLAPGEDYKAALQRSKQCLMNFARRKLMLNPPPLPGAAAAPEEGLEKYSAKYAAILRRVLAAPGSSLVYSQFLDMEGIGIFSLCLEANGFTPIEIQSSAGGYVFSERTKISLSKPDQMRYVVFTGAEKREIRSMALKMFNGRFNELPESLQTFSYIRPNKEPSEPFSLSTLFPEKNKRGAIARVFCITSAGAEGLSLKNVRQVHIMEPYWNSVRTDQVKGRAIRICSHVDLEYNEDPELNERSVEIFNYCSVFGDDAQVAPLEAKQIDHMLIATDSISKAEAEEVGIKYPQGAKQYTITSDEYLYRLSEMKRKLLSSISDIMKGSAVDCKMNEFENKEEGVKCLPMPEGSQGDFAYHPILLEDIQYTAQQFQGAQVPLAAAGPPAAARSGRVAMALAERPVPAAAAAAAQGFAERLVRAPARLAAAAAAPAVEEPAVARAPPGKKLVRILLLQIRGVKYRAIPIGEDPAKPLQYDLYGEFDKSRVKRLGFVLADPVTGAPTDDVTLRDI